MKKIKHFHCSVSEIDQILLDIQSSDDKIRGKAVRRLCPCHAGWEVFEQNMKVVHLLKKDPSTEVRAQAIHVFEDAGEMQSEGYPTNPREATNEMLRTKRASRFRPDAENTSKERAARSKFPKRYDRD